MLPSKLLTASCGVAATAALSVTATSGSEVSPARTTMPTVAWPIPLHRDVQAERMVAEVQQIHQRRLAR